MDFHCAHPNLSYEGLHKMTTQRRSRRHPAFNDKVAEEQARNEAWTKLSTPEKRIALRKRPGESKRQMSKLEAEAKRT